MTNNNADENQPVETSFESRATQSTTDWPAGRIHVLLLGMVFIVLGLFLAYLMLALWPSIPADATGSYTSQIALFNFSEKSGLVFTVKVDTQLLLLVMVAGAMGSFVHIATSFSDYVGNDRLSMSWLWWYILRPLIGMTLAVIFYIAIRGGLLSAGGQSGDINPFGIAALAGLVGMFSKQATDKLNEVFDTLFKTDKGDAKRKNSLENPVPVVSDVEPRTVEPKTQNLVVAIAGTGFVNGATVAVNGVNRETKFIGKTRLNAILLPADVDNEGELELTVFNPEPGGGHSTPIKLKISATQTGVNNSNV